MDRAEIKSASLHNPLSIFLHAYIWPFIFLWPAFFSVYLSAESYEKYINGQEWTFVFSGTIVTLQSLLWLMTFWDVNLRAWFTATRAKSVQDASLIKVIPEANAGAFANGWLTSADCGVPPVAAIVCVAPGVFVSANATLPAVDVATTS